MHSWPDDVEVRVRMGLHTGEPWVVAEGYVGMDVHRAARIADAGHGGQVLLSETTAALVLDDLPEGVTLLDLGCHQLRDMRRLEHIQQLVIDGLPADFPPLNSLASLPAALAQSAGGNGAREPRTVGPSPYRGLAAFREVDEAVFFGREAFTEQLAGAVHQQDLVAVIVGPSGSGKSSVVFAGLLPELQREGDWLIVSLRPGGRPFHALAGALLPLLEDDLSETDRLIEIQKLSAAMASGELPLFQIVERVLERHPDARRLLLVVDQFEELFTQRPDPDEQRQFLDELLTASQAGSARWTSPLVVLLTMRADFMGQALAHRPFADALQEGSLLLGPMNRAELQAVVEKPAELQGAAFEAGLVARILDDVGDEPGNLPLLEFALSLLWENMDAGLADPRRLRRNRPGGRRAGALRRGGLRSAAGTSTGRRAAHLHPVGAAGRRHRGHAAGCQPRRTGRRELAAGAAPGRPAADRHRARRGRAGDGGGGARGADPQLAAPARLDRGRPRLPRLAGGAARPRCASGRPTTATRAACCAARR